MNEIIENFNLKKYNTFNLNSTAKYFTEITSENQLDDFLNYHKNKLDKYFILSGGSNIILPEYFDGIVIFMNNKGIKIIDENEDEIILEVQAGENWHEFITFCVDNNYYGLENLAFIPGKVGSAPVQNIGAYGIEQNMFFHSLNGIVVNTCERKSLSKIECKFGYRDSIFKNELKNNFIITSVCYKLKKLFKPIISYNELKNQFENVEFNNRDLYNFIISTRLMKLPNPSDEGNAGSFFKNPIISEDIFHKIQENYPNLKGYNEKNGIKISAAWLIENSGWKGKSYDNNPNIMVSSKHSLVIINLGDATSKDVWEFSELIINDVQSKFDIKLEREVNFI